MPAVAPSWTKGLGANALPWLLEQDDSCPGVRYFALTELLGEPADSKEAVAARRAVMKTGPVAEILARQRPDGTWGDKPYGQKYTGTYWSLISLWQLGADPGDERVQVACESILDTGFAPSGVFSSYNASQSGYIHCLGGNMAASLAALGSSGGPALMKAVEGVARMVTGDGVLPKGDKVTAAKGPLLQPRFYSSGTTGPGFQCMANKGLPCGWGAAKVLLGLAAVPESRRSEQVEKALGQTVEFLLSRDPAVADYPTATNPSSNWQKFGFPVFYVTDYLTVLEGLALVGKVGDKRAAHAVEAMLAKQDEQGRWARDYAPRSPVGFNPGKVGAPNKWVTLRALRVLKAWVG